MRKLYIILVIVLAPVFSHAQSEGNIVIVNGPQVTLKDLFGQNTKDNRIIGNSPAPGKQFFVSTAQMVAIADRYRVNLFPQPNLNGLLIKRAGILIKKSLITSALRNFFKNSPAYSDLNVSVNKFDSISIPSEKILLVKVDQFQPNIKDKSFESIIQITIPGPRSLFLSASGSIEKSDYGFTAKHTISPGTKIACSDLRKIKISPLDYHVKYPLSRYDICGKFSKFPIISGNLIKIGDLVSQQYVSKGSIVTIYTKLPGLSIETEGIALSSGSVGTPIEVLNPNSKDVIKAVVVKANEAVVDPYSSPVIRAANKAFSNSPRRNYYESMHKT